MKKKLNTYINLALAKADELVDDVNLSTAVLLDSVDIAIMEFTGFIFA